MTHETDQEYLARLEKELLQADYARCRNCEHVFYIDDLTEQGSASYCKDCIGYARQLAREEEEAAEDGRAPGHDAKLIY